MAPTTMRPFNAMKSTNLKRIIEMSKFESPKRKVQLVTKKVHYNYDDENVYLKDEPIKRTHRTKNLQISDGEFEIGDLVWSQVYGSPFWLAMVAADPEKGQYHKKDLVETDLPHKYKVKEEFFVEYFGPEPSLGWNAPDKIIPFRGYDQVNSQICMYRTAQCEGSKKLKKVSPSMFNVNPNDWAVWNYAIAEAEAAMKLTKEQRIELLPFDYQWHSKDLMSTRAYEKTHWIPKRDAHKDEAWLVKPKVAYFPKKRKSFRRTKRNAHLFCDISPELEVIKKFRKKELDSDISLFVQPQFDPTEDRGCKRFEREKGFQREWMSKQKEDSEAKLDTSQDRNLNPAQMSLGSVIDPDAKDMCHVTNQNVYSPVKSNEYNMNATLKVNSKVYLNNIKNRTYKMSTKDEIGLICY